MAGGGLGWGCVCVCGGGGRIMENLCCTSPNLAGCGLVDLNKGVQS